MSIAAVPEYLGNDFSSASPGLRFGMYFQVWTDSFAKETNKVEALKRASKLNANDLAIMQHLLERQQASYEAASIGSNGLQLEAISTAPFSTGLGNEHPMENGFAFLNPYGLPYLPGSGVKGVLRQAALELSKGDWGESDWTAEHITALFGPEPESDELQRGALSFWDVIPQIKGDSLAIEIMTPHQKHYYQDKESPHDSGIPNPICFLTVPPGSGFTFHIQCNQSLLRHLVKGPELNKRWADLMQSAFKHAFSWLGFGAKTSVGYGAMAEDLSKRAVREARRQQQLEAERKAAELANRQQEIANMNPVDKAIAELLDARADKNQPEINALLIGLKEGRWSGDLAISIAEAVKAKMLAEKKWREKSDKKKPEKDINYMNTLMVKRYLEGKG